MRFKNNVGPQIRKRRSALGWTQDILAAKLQIAGLDIIRCTVSRIEARLLYVDDKTLVYLSEVLSVPIQDLFPKREVGRRLHEFMERRGNHAFLIRKHRTLAGTFRGGLR